MTALFLVDSGLSNIKFTGVLDIKFTGVLLYNRVHLKSFLQARPLLEMADLERPEEDTTSEASSYYRSREFYEKAETFITGFVAGMFLVLGVTYIVYVLIPGTECP